MVTHLVQEYEWKPAWNRIHATLTLKHLKLEIYAVGLCLLI